MGNTAWADPDFAATRARERDERAREELAAGEKVVWSGQPQLGWLFLLALPLVAVGLVTGLISWIWLEESRGGLGALLSLPLMLASVAMVLSPVWFVWRGMGTTYVITNRRAFVCEPLLFPGVAIRSYGPDALRRVFRNQRSDGSGDLIFEEGRRFRGRDRRIARRGFLAVAEARRVETILRETLLDRRGDR